MGTEKSRRKADAIAPIIALAIAGSALASCSAPQPQANPTQEPAASAAAPATTASQTLTNIGKGYAPFGHFLILPKFGERHAWVSGPTDFYVIGKGPVKISAAALLPGKQISTELYTSAGTEAKPIIAAAVEYRAPASGLDPEKYVTVLLAIDPSTGSLVKQTEVLRENLRDNAKSLTGSSDGAAVAFSTDQSNITGEPAKTKAYDVMSGQKLWERAGYSRSNVFGALTIEVDGKGVGGGKPCPRAVGVDMATGKDLFSVDYVDLDPEVCQNPTIGASASGAFIPGLSEKFLYTRIAATGAKEAAFNALTGAPVTLPNSLLAADPRSNLVVGTPAGAYTDEKPFVVTDATTGTVKYTLDAARAGQLRATVDALYGGKLYVKTTDQHPVVDVATGKTITDNAPQYPVGAVDSWTYWSDGRLDKTS